MSFLFNSKPLIACFDNFPVDLASNSVNRKSLFGSNPLHPSFVDDSDLIISSNHVQTPLPSFIDEPKVGSVNTADGSPHFDSCLSIPNSQTFSLDGSVRNSSSWYSTDSYPLYNLSQVHSFSDFPLFHPSELIAKYPDPYTPISPLPYPTYQYLGNQFVFHEPNNIDITGKHFHDDFDNQPCSEITQQGFLVGNQTLDVMRLGNNVHPSSLSDNYTFNDDAFVHRFNQESLSPFPGDHFTGRSEQNGEVAQTMMSVAHVDGADFLSLETLLKRKALEEGDEEEERKKRRNMHRCKLCDMSFSTGNALGGHMSYHAKKKKLEAKRIAKAELMSKQPLHSDVSFAYAHAARFQGSVNHSMNPFMW